MNVSTLLKLAMALLVAFFAVEKLRVHYADQRLQNHGLAAVSQPLADSPAQEATSQAAFEFRGYQVKPLATFAVRARVLSREDYYVGKEAELSPLDLALGWKRMADPAVYEALNITQGGRWYRYTWRDQPPIPLQEIIESSANMHMIAATPVVERALKKARAGGLHPHHRQAGGGDTPQRLALDEFAHTVGFRGQFLRAGVCRVGAGGELTRHRALVAPRTPNLIAACAFPSSARPCFYSKSYISTGQPGGWRAQSLDTLGRTSPHPNHRPKGCPWPRSWK
jgi:hypothetical protein